jgi:hypothetical protein
MREVLFKLGMFNNEATRASSERILRALLDVLLLADIEYLRANPNTPRIYNSGVWYEREPLPEELAARFPQCHSPCRPEIHPEEWKAIPFCIDDIARGIGSDCEDLASWCAAERIVYDHLDAKTDFSFRRVAPNLLVYHIFVRLPDGSIEDPSVRLGMRTS